MIRGVCDDGSRLLFRLFEKLEVDCPCCTFYRGAMLGGAVVGIAAAALWLIF